MKLKQKNLKYKVNLPSSSDENLYTDYFIWQVVYGLLAIIYSICIYVRQVHMFAEILNIIGGNERWENKNMVLY